MASKVIHAIYNDDDILMHAVKQTRAAHYHIDEVYTPFPVHGLDKVMGLEPTRIAITAFMYGVVGFCVAIAMMNFIMIVIGLRILVVNQVLVISKTCLPLYPLCLS